MVYVVLVVICLKNRTFAVSQTTFLILPCANKCCDLLEKSYFCSIANNCKFNKIVLLLLWFAWKIVLLQYRKQHLRSKKKKSGVVICLKNRTFAVSQTTIMRYLGKEYCCDLLEKSYFCSIANNPCFWASMFWYVVICLKNRTFAVSQTTCRSVCSDWKALWFAWKIVLLQYRKQHAALRLNTQGSCDLLEKSYFCSIANNK